MQRGHRHWITAVAVLLSSLPPAAASAQQAAAARPTRVIYLARDWLFIDAGWGEGLRQGSEVEVVRRGRTIAVLRVESVGDGRASCAIVSLRGVLVSSSARSR